MSKPKYSRKKSGRVASRKQRVVVGSSWDEMEIRAREIPIRYSALNALLLVAGLLLVTAAIFFVVTRDRDGIVGLMGIASNVFTGTLCWALGNKSQS